MQIQTETISLQLTTPFKVSYGASKTRENVLFHISDGTYTGTGEAAIVPYYDVTQEQVLEELNSPELAQVLSDEPLYLDDVLEHLPPGLSSQSQAAVDIALHDLWGKRLGHPLYQLWGLNPNHTPVNSFTVGMDDDIAFYREKLCMAQHYPLIKLKLGTGDLERDKELVTIAQEEVTSQLCVDANGAWNIQEGLEMLPWLHERAIVFIEQPVSKSNFEGWRVLRNLPFDQRPPLIADESVQGLPTVRLLIGLVDGINIKLAKCGGLRAARDMIIMARAFGLRIMLGCMIESSVALTAAAHLAPYADYLDLDSILLLKNDPYHGVKLDKGKTTLPDAPGLGLERSS